MSLAPSPAWLRPIPLLLLSLVLATASAAPATTRAISCLGRLEPGEGVRRLASPGGGGGVIAEMKVREGDTVEAGQVLATLSDHALRSAEVSRLVAEMEKAQREEARLKRLSQSQVSSAARLETAGLDLRIAHATLAAARALLELSVIRAPIAGQVLEIYARPGERTEAQGVLEIGATDRMYAVAEVYETDIADIHEGNSARITSPALPRPLEGTVESIGLKVGRMDVLGTDPIAKTDARVVEVRIRLDDAGIVASLTHLQVEIEIDP